MSELVLQRATSSVASQVSQLRCEMSSGMQPLELLRESLGVRQEDCRKLQAITFGMFQEMMVHL
ncbi:hypothetical protein K649_07305 [Meiothermus ruber DSM 1279]|uniref:Uncharacterized protein n=1 Tax=Meiothermus ruber (strain ATCC 35948 / DSM 1279 / VKM B-1258 / 21) TaxID=504728 RepID=M9XCU0_MEIRD|nr:hypothetical protein K649_07305 [Meiothermus ruber DSM 1279]